MRVVAQDGTLDFPYENSIVFIDARGVRDKAFVRMQAVGDNEASIMAQYSTAEKAQKAMEMLREAYTGMPIVMQNIDISEDVAKEFERLKKCGVMVRTENQPSKIECISNSVFQFPSEEELE
nr:MAG TPA: hypothetical protein [Caudoviricetes sp.]